MDTAVDSGTWCGAQIRAAEGGRGGQVPYERLTTPGEEVGSQCTESEVTT